MLYLLNSGNSEANGNVEFAFPCGDVHYVIIALVSTACSDTGLLNRFFGWALALMITVILMFLTFLEKYHWKSILNFRKLFNISWCMNFRLLCYFYALLIFNKILCPFSWSKCLQFFLQYIYTEKINFI